MIDYDSIGSLLGCVGNINLTVWNLENVKRVVFLKINL